MSQPVIRILHPGMGITVQDAGRTGWKSFGVPWSGPMDPVAADAANRLAGNPPGTPVLEILLHGAELEFLQTTWAAIAGAHTCAALPAWTARIVQAGEILEFVHPEHGVWTYLAVPGGFHASSQFGSCSHYIRGGIGAPIVRGTELTSPVRSPLLPSEDRIGARLIPQEDRLSYDQPPELTIWPGPEWKLLSSQSRRALLEAEWTVRSDSDRIGYRLQGPKLELRKPTEMRSEPSPVGTVQLPPDGNPIVLLRDGPTVGGYPKIAVVDPPSLPCLAQSQPGRTVKFHLCKNGGAESEI
jgi:biotin-dependent carboxylase-like uncharacterized protein